MNEVVNESLQQCQCDECGKFVARIWRVYKGHRYCSTCYARVFKRRMCPKCGNYARLPKNKPGAICRGCETDKPCIRCGKTDFATGKITSYGPVCKACLPYFHEPNPCGLCGKPSIFLSRVKRLNIDVPVCPACARQDHSTCQACRRFRLLTKASDGRMLCKGCLEKGSVPCPKCGETMPAGYGQQCETCYWKGLLEKRIKIDCAAFSSPQMTAYFETFGQWLGCKVGERKAASTIHSYLSFFIEIGQQWETIPKYEELLAHFGALKLRRSQLPMTWMAESETIVFNTFAKEEDSDKRRIKAILDKFPEKSQASEILTSFYQSLIEKLKDEKTTIRSIRLALSPASAFLQKASEMQCMPPEQRALDAYLKTAPGQRAAISGLICYLEDKHGIKLILPKPDTLRTQRNRRKKLEREMLILMQENSNSDEFQRLWLSTALAYFHGLPKKVGKTIANEHIAVLEDGNFEVTWNKKTYWIPFLKSK